MNSLKIRTLFTSPIKHQKPYSNSAYPNRYIPVIPLVLVNGSRGVGSGWSSFIPSYDPLNIIANMRCLLEDKSLVSMVPWYRGFKGKIEKSGKKGVYKVSGDVTYLSDDDTFVITELPIGTYTHGYKKFLDSITEGSSNVKDPLIEHFRQVGDGAIVQIEIKMKQNKKDLMKELFEKLRLTTLLSTENMHFFDNKGILRKFDTPDDIMKDFFKLRMEYYEKRREYILSNLNQVLLILGYKVEFMSMVVNGEIRLINRKKAELLAELEKKFPRMRRRKGKSAEPKVVGANVEYSEAPEDDNYEEQETTQKEATSNDYEYLISMPLETLTEEDIEKLKVKMEKKKKELQEFQSTTVKSLWMADLDELEKKYREIYGFSA